MEALVLDAYAKVNLGLRVLGTRPDGLHDIESVFQTIDWADQLSLTRSSDLDVRVETSPDSGIDPDRNLVRRAASLIQERHDVQLGVGIRLGKRIPIGAGLGGGSSDAAATLIGLACLWDLDLNREGLHPLSLELGSDVPFFLWGGRCRVRGRGERVEPMDDGDRFADETFVLLVPPWSLPTADVYRTFDQLNGRSLFESPYPNDLEAAALRLQPRLTGYRDWLAREGVAFGLSGSGPVYFAVMESLDEAISLATAARRALAGDVLVCRPTPRGHHPAIENL